MSACVHARLPHSAHRAEAAFRTLDCGVHQQQPIPQPLSTDKGPASFQPRVARRPEVLMPRLRGALRVGGTATGSSSAPSFPARRPGRAGAVRLRRSCGRGVVRGPVPEDGGGGGDLGVSLWSAGERIWKGTAQEMRWLSGRGATYTLTLQAGCPGGRCWGIQDLQVGPAGRRDPGYLEKGRRALVGDSGSRGQV